MKKFKEINLKNLNKKQKEVVTYLNKMILEHQQVFQSQPEELLISKYDFNLLLEDIEDKQDYLLLGKIKIYHI